jgi:hypothetical protein
MSLHFVGSARNQAGKSWFIRAAIEYLRQKSPVVMLDASADKSISILDSIVIVSRRIA